jgi:hypothetical protein
MRRRVLTIAHLCVVILVLGGMAALLVSYRAPGREQSTAALQFESGTQSATEVQSLERDTIIQGYRCGRGWVHFHATGALRRFTSTEPIPLGRDTIPPGTWVTLDPNGALIRCNFPADTIIQGQLCRGTGGPKGTGTSFHSDGTLESFFPPADTSIQGVKCAGGMLDQMVGLHENGKLREAVLGENSVLDGHRCRKGDRVTWDQAGRVVSVTGPTWAERQLRTLFAWFE